MRLGELNNIEKKGIQFLAPCEAEIHMCQEYGRQIPYYTADFKSIYLNMTPTLYEVVMGVVNTITLSGLEKHAEQAKKQQETEESEPNTKYIMRRENFFSQYDNTDDQVVDIDEIDAALNVETDKCLDVKRTKVLEALDLDIGEFIITFCEESGLDLQPLAIVKMQLDARVSNWTRNMHCKADLTLEAVYYNDFLSTWEPLIENVMHKEDNYRPWILSLWFAMEPGNVLKPPSPGETIDNGNCRFPINDLNYTRLDNEVKIFSKTEPQPIVHSPQPISRVSTSSSNTISANPMFSESIGHANIATDTHSLTTSVTLQQASYILIESNDVLNLNVTPSAYKVSSFKLRLEELKRNRNEVV